MTIRRVYGTKPVTRISTRDKADNGAAIVYAFEKKMNRLLADIDLSRSISADNDKWGIDHGGNMVYTCK